MSELKRPEIYVHFESIKPKFKEITEFYTQKIADYQYRLKQLNEYADALENEISVLKETPKVEVLLDDTPKPLVEVPKFFADWFENQLKNNESKKFDGNDVFRIIQDVIKVSNGESTWGDFGITDEIVEFAEDNEELFLNLIVNCSVGNGYTVEKEQLYEVVFAVNEDGDRYLLLESDGFFIDNESMNEGYYKQQFTKAEIKDIDERYWEFRVEVDE